MLERILLATDGSAHAYEALKYARDLALRHGSRLVVVHAFEPVSTYMAEPWLHLRVFRDSERPFLGFCSGGTGVRSGGS